MQLGSGSVSPKAFAVGGVELDDEAKTVTRDGTTVILTPTEFEILKLLMSNPGKVFSPKDIYKSIWKEAPVAADNSVAVHIRHIREKLEINSAEPRYVKAVWGHGYFFDGGKK
jgi:DNA-binding response OmpR family regulator